MKRILVVLFAVMMFAASCSQSANPTDSPQATPTAAPTQGTIVDREGTTVTLPVKVEKIISIGASNTEILSALGLLEKIVAVDSYSMDVEGIASDITTFDQLNLDAEKMVSLMPDVVFISSMSKSGGDDPLKLVRDAGVCVLYIPSSTSIQAIKDDIAFVGKATNLSGRANEIIAEMDREIAEIKSIGDTITEKKSVYFEISPAPTMYSFGKGVFLNEMLEIIGAENTLGSMSDWVAVSDETVLSLNPDVILTNISYLPDPIGEIKSRPGWDAVTAVQNDAVYYIDANFSSRPDQNIIKALRQMAEAVYPAEF